MLFHQLSFFSQLTRISLSFLIADKETILPLFLPASFVSHDYIFICTLYISAWFLSYKFIYWLVSLLLFMFLIFMFLIFIHFENVLSCSFLIFYYVFFFQIYCQLTNSFFLLQTREFSPFSVVLYWVYVLRHYWYFHYGILIMCLFQQLVLMYCTWTYDNL